MIHNGECGSYNPLLLRCLDDVSDTAKQGMKDAGQTVAPLRRVVEELYKGQDLAAARMTQQLEDAYAKQDFFTSLSDELWFDYTAQPSSLHLSRGLAEQTGLPSVMLEPLQSPTLQMYLGKELTEGLKRQLEGLTLEETRLDLTTKLRLRGRLRRCQLSVQITWSARKQRRCAALLGKVTDIEDRSQCIEQLRAEIQHAETPQTLSQPPPADIGQQRRDPHHSPSAVPSVPHLSATVRDGAAGGSRHLYAGDTGAGRTQRPGERLLLCHVVQKATL